MADNKAAGDTSTEGVPISTRPPQARQDARLPVGVR